MSNFLQKTYIVCNSIILQHIKKIKGFQLNLGQSLINKQTNMMQHNDISIQTHIMYFEEIILLCGYLGSLGIYSNGNYKTNMISFFNGKERVDLEFNDFNDMFSVINNGLNEMAIKTGYTTDIENKDVIELNKIKEEYIKPNKLLKDMNEQERLAYIRNMK